LQPFGHRKNGQPPAAIGSSPDGVTSGGQNFHVLWGHCAGGFFRELARHIFIFRRRERGFRQP
jgi:hypothetical protein